MPKQYLIEDEEVSQEEYAAERKRHQWLKKDAFAEESDADRDRLPARLGNKDRLDMMEIIIEELEARVWALEGK